MFAPEGPLQLMALAWSSVAVFKVLGPWFRVRSLGFLLDGLDVLAVGESPVLFLLRRPFVTHILSLMVPWVSRAGVLALGGV